MAKTLLIHCKPFDRNINIFMLDKETEIASIVGIATTEQLPEAILHISESKDCYCLNIKGNKIYTKGISRKIQNAEIAKYNQNKIQINLIK